MHTGILFLGCLNYEINEGIPGSVCGKFKGKLVLERDVA